MKQISPNGLNLIKSFEGYRSTAYKAHKNEKYYTIGFGHYGADVVPGMVINPFQAYDLLKKDVKQAEAAVNKYDRLYNWTQNEYDALVSFAYNIGSIDQLTAKGTRSKDVIADKMLEYNKCGKTVLRGLELRRMKERALYVKK